MPELTLATAFDREVIDDVIRNVDVENLDWLQNFMGVQQGGPNAREHDDRKLVVPVWATARTTLQGTDGPSDWPVGEPPNVGEQVAWMALLNESVPYYEDDFKELYRLGRGADTRMGRMQRDDLLMEEKKNGVNTREIALVGMLGDRLKKNYTGGKWRFSLSTGTAVSFQHKASHASQLNLGGNIIAASWGTAGTNIPNHQRSLFAKCSELGLRPPRIWRCNEVTFNATFAINTVLNPASKAYDPLIIRAQNITPNADVQLYQYREMPDVLIHVDSRRIQNDGAAVAAVADNVVEMYPTPDRTWIRGAFGSRSYGPLPGQTEPARIAGMSQWFEWGSKTEAVLCQKIVDTFLFYGKADETWRPTVVF